MHLLERPADQAFVDTASTVIGDGILNALARRGRCVIGLSGGSTPRPVYEALGAREDIDWQHVSVFLLDERYVPADHAESNQRLVRETLLRHAVIPEDRLHVPHTALPINECVMAYAKDLNGLFQEHLPDLAVLGMGEDGHIASLFPPLTEDLADDSRLVAHATTDRFAVRDRITLTLNPIANAGKHVVLLKGAEKKNIWEEMLASDEHEARWPMKRVLESSQDSTVVAQW